MKKLIVAALAAVLSATSAFAQLPGGPGAQIPNSAGGSGGGGSGTVTSIATACAVAGGTITTTGTIRGAAAEDIVAGTTYSAVDGDCGRIKRFSNAALVTVTLGSPAGFTNASTWFTTLKADGAAGLSVTPSGSTLDGGAGAITVAQGKSLDVYSDGTNWHSLPGNGGGAAPGGSSGQIQTNNGSGGFNGGNLSGNCVTSASLVTNCDFAHPGYIPSNWYVSPTINGSMATGTATGSANRIVCSFNAIPQKITIGGMGARVQTAGTSNFQLAIYTSSSGRPGALIGNTGNIATTGATMVTAALAANKQVGPGGTDGGRDVWFCMNVNDTTTVFIAQNTTNAGQLAYLGDATASNLISGVSGGAFSISCAGAACQPGGVSTFGSWPASLVGSTWTFNNTGGASNIMPIVIFQPASVP